MRTSGNASHRYNSKEGKRRTAVSAPNMWQRCADRAERSRPGKIVSLFGEGGRAEREHEGQTWQKETENGAADSHFFSVRYSSPINPLALYTPHWAIYETNRFRGEKL